ncbi:MAG: DNA gyrase subunit A [Thermoguttaceae bacterium]|nr:DNA gyrase subunit A [Thermoguttaceae bacterium]
MNDISAGKLVNTSIEDEMKISYLTYSMSVIVSRALPDARDGFKPSQRRILVAMNDLGLTPGAATSKCAGIVGETMKSYHPHGDQSIYPTLVRMGQEWNTRYLLVQKQGNFGSIAGLPPAAMRYTEAKMSPITVMMLEDYKMDTVDFIPNYDEKTTEPTVLPSKFPNLLVNGSQGIAVGMATSIPPHNLSEICDAVVKMIDDPDVSADELLEIVPGPDFPTGGVICGRRGIRRGYLTGRGTITVRARARIEEFSKNRHRIVVSEIPYMQARDRVEERIAELVNDGRLSGISAIRNESDLKEPVRLILELKRDADPDVVLNQLYQFSSLQDSFSLIFLALVDGKPRILSFKELVREFLRHRVTVIRRRTQFLLQKARQRKHTVEGLLLAHANIDEVIRTIRSSRTQAEAKERIMQIACPAALMHRALGDDGFASYQKERGVKENYYLTPVQADAILRMTLGQLVNLEQEQLASEFHQLLADINEYLSILADEAKILAIIREDMSDIKKRFGDARRTEITGQEVDSVDLSDLIEEEHMVVSISSDGYVKRTATNEYRVQNRGGKGLKGAKTDDESPIEHLFVASTHDYMLFFTTKGRVHWLKVWDLPEQARTSKGRSVVNLLHLETGEQIASCKAVRDFTDKSSSLVMITRRGLVKKTKLEAYSRPKKNGIIAMGLKDGDELVQAMITRPGDELVIATSKGMTIRFRESDARPMGRNACGVKGIRLGAGDHVVGAVVADPDGYLLTVCEHGYGKRTPFGPNSTEPIPMEDDLLITDGDSEELSTMDSDVDGDSATDTAEGAEDTLDGIEDADVSDADLEGDSADDPDAENNSVDGEERNSGRSYRTQKRGGKGIRDIKTTKRNGPVVGVVCVSDADDLFVMTARGKLQRIRVSDVGVVGRNTQGVRIMNLDEGDSVIAAKRVPPEEVTTHEGNEMEV